MFRRVSAFFALCALSTLTFAAGCSSSTVEQDDPGSEDELSTKNLAAGDFGLADHEVVLTIDDGPGPRTPELVDFLVKEKVPAVFFEVGKNARANPEAVAHVVENAAKVPGNLIIGNHSMNHSMTPLPQMGRDGAMREILDADAIEKDSIQKAQANFPSATFFFRPPFGAFTALGSANIATINQSAAGKYVGPVFWNIGGELNAQFSADWACWGKNGRTVGACMDGYIREAKARGRGLILVHDVHSKTVDMLTGTGDANGRSLIKELRAAGFKFVGLRSHEAALANYANGQQQLQASTDVDIVAKTDVLDDGQVQVSIESQGAAKLKIIFDNDTQGAQVTSDAHPTLKKALAPGQHFVTVAALDAQGHVLKAEKATFIVPADIEDGSHEAQGQGNAVCVNFNLMKQGQKFYLYHSKISCDDPHATRPVGLDDCYRFFANLTATRNPKLVGAGEWSVDFDVSYPADPSDKSKMTFVVESGTGEVVSGRRYAWTAGGKARPDVPMSGDSVDCENGIWRGKMHYANGTTEDVLFRTLASPRDGASYGIGDKGP